jgi:hypothetical protein
MLTPPRSTLDSFEPGDRAEVCTIGDDAVIIAYEVHEELHVDGQPAKLDAAETSTWGRRDGRWLRAAPGESVAGDP